MSVADINSLHGISPLSPTSASALSPSNASLSGTVRPSVRPKVDRRPSILAAAAAGQPNLSSLLYDPKLSIRSRRGAANGNDFATTFAANKSRTVPATAPAPANKFTEENNPLANIPLEVTSYEGNVRITALTGQAAQPSPLAPLPGIVDKTISKEEQEERIRLGKHRLCGCLPISLRHLMPFTKSTPLDTYVRVTLLASGEGRLTDVVKDSGTSFTWKREQRIQLKFTPEVAEYQMRKSISFSRGGAGGGAGNTSHTHQPQASPHSSTNLNKIHLTSLSSNSPHTNDDIQILQHHQGATTTLHAIDERQELIRIASTSGNGSTTNAANSTTSDTTSSIQMTNIPSQAGEAEMRNHLLRLSRQIEGDDTAANSNNNKTDVLPSSDDKDKMLELKHSSSVSTASEGGGKLFTLSPNTPVLQHQQLHQRTHSPTSPLVSLDATLPSSSSSSSSSTIDGLNSTSSAITVSDSSTPLRPRSNTHPGLASASSSSAIDNTTIAAAIETKTTTPISAQPGAGLRLQERTSFTKLDLSSDQPQQMNNNTVNGMSPFPLPLASPASAIGGRPTTSNGGNTTTSAAAPVDTQQQQPTGPQLLFELICCSPSRENSAPSVDDDRLVANATYDLTECFSSSTNIQNPKKFTISLVDIDSMEEQGELEVSIAFQELAVAKSNTNGAAVGGDTVEKAASGGASSNTTPSLKLRTLQPSSSFSSSSQPTTAASTTTPLTFSPGTIHITLHRVSSFTDPFNPELLYHADWKLMRNMFLVVLLYLAMGIIFYQQYEGWTFLESVYFCLVTATTTGYGDLHPTTEYSRIFTMFFILVGIGLIAVALGIGGGLMLERQEQELLKKLIQEREANVQRQSGIVLQPPWISRTLQRVLYSFAMFNCVLWGGAIGFWYLEEGLSFLDATYLCVVTMSTVGYGDRSPKSSSARAFCCPWIVVSALVVTRVVGEATDMYMTWTRNKRAEAVLKNSINSVEDLAGLDDDNSGQVSELEFLKHMLIATNACKQREIDTICQQFHALDVDGSGFLDANDFKKMAEEKQARRNSHMVQIGIRG